MKMSEPEDLPHFLAAINSRHRMAPQVYGGSMGVDGCALVQSGFTAYSLSPTHIITIVVFAPMTVEFSIGFRGFLF